MRTPRLLIAVAAGIATVAVVAGAAEPKEGKPMTTSEKKVLVVLTSHETLGSTGKKTGFYLGEVTHPLQVFEKAGYTVEYASPRGGQAPMDGVKRDDPVNARYLDDPAFLKAVGSTMKPSEVDPARYAAVFYAGGHGTMWDFPDETTLQAITAKVYEAGGVVAAVCHGPAGLVNVKLKDGEYLVKGKAVSSFTDDEEAAVQLTDVVPFLLERKLIERGAKHEKADNFQKKVVVSERLVTGQNPASAAGVAEAVVALLSKAK